MYKYYNAHARICTKQMCIHIYIHISVYVTRLHGHPYTRTPAPAHTQKANASGTEPHIHLFINTIRYKYYNSHACIYILKKANMHIHRYM